MTVLYTLKEAAALLGKHPQTIKYHKYETGYLKDLGIVKGKTLVFTDEDLTEMRRIFAEVIPAPGRPPNPPMPKRKIK